ncbi:hypothetical protein [Desulfitobacterium sp.]|uniref:hypothetical protein n=1 Tax=Desulfitobacterium sp. TaxID=49981 RepID=UPI002B9C7B07|nr:hypothetical protein [Desulfitobacterium sp.]HVJ49225.1 hypothetical protein [Desulfitobacterium sp.]
MFFIDDEHEETFYLLVSRKFKENDPEYEAAFYVLTADNELRKKGMPFITPDGIDWEGIWNNDWSSGYRILLKLTESLFKSSGSVELAYGLGVWGEELYRVAMQAIGIRRKAL